MELEEAIRSVFSNVDNTSDLNKPISTATKQYVDTQLTEITASDVSAMWNTLQHPTVYVDGTTGNDSNDGLSESKAVKTLSHAINLTGDTGHVRMLSTAFIGTETVDSSITVNVYLPEGAVINADTGIPCALTVESAVTVSGTVIVQGTDKYMLTDTDCGNVELTSGYLWLDGNAIKTY